MLRDFFQSYADPTRLATTLRLPFSLPAAARIA